MIAPSTFIGVKNNNKIIAVEATNHIANLIKSHILFSLMTYKFMNLITTKGIVNDGKRLVQILIRPDAI